MTSPSVRAIKPPHPTRLVLIEAARACLEQSPWDQVTVELVLERCGVSRSSLYHHFEDFQDLLEQSIAEAISEGSRQSIESFRQILESATSSEDLRSRLFAYSNQVQARERAPVRMQRLVAIAATDRNERYRLTLARMHETLDRGFQEVIEAAQVKGWIDPSVDARAVSLFIQAYTFGRVLDDLSTSPIDQNRWNALIEKILDPLLFGHLG